MRILGVDPGVVCTGLAIVEDGPLPEPWCAAVRGSVRTLSSTILRVGNLVSEVWFDHLVIEVPQVYGRRDERDPNDLIPLALIAGAAVRAAQAKSRPVSWHVPREWKGTMDGDVFAARTLVALTAAERAVFEALKLPAKLRHNALDAFAIAKWHAGRIAAKVALERRLAAGRP